MEQQVTLSVQEFAKMVGDNSTVEKAEKTPAVSKEDYLRLANLKIDKMFNPKIKALENSLDKLNAELLEKYPTSKAQEYALKAAKSDARTQIKEIQKTVEAHYEYRKEWAAFLEGTFDRVLGDDASVPKLHEDELGISLGLVTTDSDTFSYCIMGKKTTVKTVSYAISKSETHKNWDKKSADLRTRITKAEDALEIMRKCHSKAKTEVIAEVEEGILESMISKNAEASTLAGDLEDRLKAVANQNLLTS